MNIRVVFVVAFCIGSISCLMGYVVGRSENDETSLRRIRQLQTQEQAWRDLSEEQEKEIDALTRLVEAGQ